MVRDPSLSFLYHFLVRPVFADTTKCVCKNTILAALSAARSRALVSLFRTAVARSDSPRFVPRFAPPRLCFHRRTRAAVPLVCAAAPFAARLQPLAPSVPTRQRARAPGSTRRSTLPPALYTRLAISRWRKRGDRKGYGGGNARWRQSASAGASVAVGVSASAGQHWNCARNSLRNFRVRTHAQLHHCHPTRAPALRVPAQTLLSEQTEWAHAV